MDLSGDDISLRSAGGKGFDLSCPRDALPMDHLQIGTVGIDRCRACGGVWLDAIELQKLRAFVELGGSMGGDLKKQIQKADPGYGASNRVTGRRKGMRCPRDGGLLETVSDPQQPHVQYEVCRGCGGMFLDAGELRDLTEFTLSEKLFDFFKK